MLRSLHSLPALVAAVLVCFMAITGTVLSLQPVIDHFTVPAVTETTLSAAELAANVASTHPDVEKIVRQASGAVVVYSSGAGFGARAADIVDPSTGRTVSSYRPSGFFTFVTELHRSLFMGETGRAVAGVAALAMLILTLSGIALTVNRLGGWGRLLTPAKGTRRQRWHVTVSRLAVLLLMLTALTGGYMSLVNFGFVSDGTSGLGGLGAFPAGMDGGAPAPVGQLAALRKVPLSDLRELTFPAPNDPSDVFTLVTASGQGYVDQASGALLSFTPNNLGQSVYQTVYMLHTGQGQWVLALLLGLAAAAVPVLAVTGVLVWSRRRRAMPRLTGQTPATRAEAVVLVGSEGNATWGFAAELHEKLHDAGLSVHTGPMNEVADLYDSALIMFILTSTHGDGGAPASANKFMARLGRFKYPPRLHFSVLGFGDNSFEHYCGFAVEVDETLRGKGWRPLDAPAFINRQSAQAFADWGRRTGERIGHPLRLAHTPMRPATQRLILDTRLDYGQEVQTPTAILRFRPDPDDHNRFGLTRRLPRHVPGDLVAIVPPGSNVPRYYSLASSSRYGFAEICVRKQTGGLCSEFLHDLEPGMTVDGFVESNPSFRPQPGRAPLILIGAGTGIAPFAGLVTANFRNRPIHLYWGGRDPMSDFLYRDTLRACLADGRLTRLNAVFSRSVGGSYVQDEIGRDAGTVASLVDAGAQIMVCGGKEMAESVRATLDDILAMTGRSLNLMRGDGRYVEDVY